MDEQKLAALEWARENGMSTEEQLEFSLFQVGFPATMSFSDIYISYMAAKHGPEAISMDTQEATT